MDTVTRRKVETAVRVRDFVLAHPREDAGFAVLVAQIQDAVARARQFEADEIDGILEDRAATERRNGIRRLVNGDLLRPLARIGAAAARTTPELAGLFPAPDDNATHAECLALAKRMHEHAVKHAETLAKFGLPATLLDDLGVAVAKYDAITTQQNHARRRHVDAGVQLEQLLVEIGRIIRLLDGYYRYAFRDDPAAKAVWKHVSNVVTRTKAAPADVPDEADPLDAPERPAA